MLILDDTTLDKPYARYMDLVTRHWSGKHLRVVAGINVLTLLWTDGMACLPCDCRIYDKPLPNGHTKNEQFRAMLTTAKQRGFAPTLVCFDSWYSSLDNLKAVRTHGWHFLTRLNHNQHVNPDGHGNVPLDTVVIPTSGRAVHLKGFGLVQVFRIAAPDGSAEYWATNKLDMRHTEREAVAAQAWTIEEYHRGVKQGCGVERAQVRKATAQRNHIVLAVRAFVRLDVHRLHTGVCWYTAKTALLRTAIRAYRTCPTLRLSATA